MTPEKLSIKAAIQVQKSAHEVFEAIVDPEKMSNYFISKGSARMEEGKNLTWRFPEFDSEAPVRVDRIEKNKFISFIWDGEAGNIIIYPDKIKNIELHLSDNSFLVCITSFSTNFCHGIKIIKKGDFSCHNLHFDNAYAFIKPITFSYRPF